MNFEEETMLEEYPSILTPRECMDALCIGRNTFYKLVQTGELPAKKVGGKLLRIAKKDLIGYILSH